jgi:hypothetical protein
MLDQKNSKKRGDAGMGIAIGWFASKGWTVCVPLTDSQDYDLLVDDEFGILKVQVKTTTYKHGNNYQAALRTIGGNRSGTGKVKLFNPLTVDYLFVVTEEGTMYYIPSDKVRGTTAVSLGKRMREYIVTW